MGVGDIGSVVAYPEAIAIVRAAVVDAQAGVEGLC